jgi:hypothetical protein
MKEELLRNSSALFALLEACVDGFLASTAVLSEENYTTLFLVESATVGDWDDYQFIIGTLIEQVKPVI